MATQRATPPVAPSAKVVGYAFVEQYYHILHSSPQLAYKFYQDSSVLSRPDHNGVSTSVTTVEHINHKICSLDYNNCKAEIKTADAQDSYHGGVIVLVTGSLTGKDNRTRTFSQTFFLAPQETGYFVLNDVLRYVEACEPSENAEISETSDSSTPLIKDQAPPHAINPKKLDQAISHDAGGPNVHEHLEEEIQDWEEIVVEADSHLSDMRSHSVVTPEALPPATGNFALSDSKDSENEAEDYSIYIKNLPRNLTVDQLETEIKRFGPIKQNGVQVRRNMHQGFAFGFVEFEELSSMQSAIQASPIIIGTREAIVEKKRTKRRGSGENSSYSGGQRIMYPSESFRGRRNFNVGGRGAYWSPRNQSSEIRGRGRGGW